MKTHAMSNKETSTTDGSFDFAVKTASEKLHNRVYSIVNDLINKSCDHVSDMLIVPGTFRTNPEIGYDEYKINMLCRTIVYALHSSFDIDEDLAWNITSKAIIDKFKFKHCLDPKSNQAFVQYLTHFVCRNLPFDKSMELEKKPNT